MRDFQEIWELAIPYLKRGVRKDFVLHTKSVTKAMELLLQKEKSDRDILIPAAILHDVGWADEEGRHQALKLHIEYAPRIVEKILTELNFEKKKIERIVDIIVAHKFQDPKDSDKQLLIDADTLSDCFKEDFYSNVEAYGDSPKNHWEFRMKTNKFYTETAREIFEKEMKKRREEIYP